jgi:hypothetical protein
MAAPIHMPITNDRRSILFCSSDRECFSLIVPVNLCVGARFIAPSYPAQGAIHHARVILGAYQLRPYVPHYRPLFERSPYGAFDILQYFQAFRWISFTGSN